MTWAIYLLEAVIVLLAVPGGFLIAWMARDELIQGRVWFRVLMIISIILAIGFYLTGVSYISLTCLFIFIIALISYSKSFDRKWTKAR